MKMRPRESEWERRVFLLLFGVWRRKIFPRTWNSRTWNMVMEENSIWLDHAQIGEALVLWNYIVLHSHPYTHKWICFISTEEIFSYDDALSNEKFSPFQRGNFHALEINFGDSWHWTVFRHDKWFALSTPGGSGSRAIQRRILTELF